ncbi:hypothetical protein Q8A73_009198 [Channa argus]|nr:hypothetical protein Q8A73_009198 [Channa argus]
MLHGTEPISRLRHPEPFCCRGYKLSRRWLQSPWELERCGWEDRAFHSLYLCAPSPLFPRPPCLSFPFFSQHHLLSSPQCTEGSREEPSLYCNGKPRVERNQAGRKGGRVMQRKQAKGKVGGQEERLGEIYIRSSLEEDGGGEDPTQALPPPQAPPGLAQVHGFFLISLHSGASRHGAAMSPGDTPYLVAHPSFVQSFPQLPSTFLSLCLTLFVWPPPPLSWGIPPQQGGPAD